MAFIRKTLSLALAPSLTATLGLALTIGPPSIREPLLQWLGQVLSEQNIERLITALKWLTAFGVARAANSRLNVWALNNWRWGSVTKQWEWAREVAVITGGSSGIGLEVVKQLRRKGIKVAVFDIQTLPKEIDGYANVEYIKCDVTEPSSIAEAAAKLRSKWGNPTILINNAGIGKPHSLVDIPNEFVTKIFAINVISHFWLIKEFMPAMLEKNKGHIVGVASMASWVAPPGMVDYAATKAAVLGLHEGLNLELRNIYKKPGVLTTIVHPNWVRTPLVGEHESHIEKTQGKLLKPEHVAQKIVDQIFSCRGGQLFIPSGLSIATSIRAQANWLQEAIRDFVVGGVAVQPPSI